MLESVKTLDENLFVFLNAHHNPFFDQVMWLFSETVFWIPLYIFVLWMLHKRFPKHFWTVLLAIGLMIAASDQLCNVFKYSVMRFRPTSEPHIQALVHTVNGYRGGTYGFYSAHSSNAFSLACFIIAVGVKQRKYIIPIVLIYAILTAYSRIYLGVHYPGDVLTGAIIGAILGIVFAYLHNKLRARYLTSWD